MIRTLTPKDQRLILDFVYQREEENLFITDAFERSKNPFAHNTFYGWFEGGKLLGLAVHFGKWNNLNINAQGLSQNKLTKGWVADDERIACATGATDEDVAALRRGRERGRKPRVDIGCAHHSLENFVTSPKDKKIVRALTDHLMVEKHKLEDLACFQRYGKIIIDQLAKKHGMTPKKINHETVFKLFKKDFKDYSTGKEEIAKNSDRKELILFGRRVFKGDVNAPITDNELKRIMVNQQFLIRKDGKIVSTATVSGLSKHYFQIGGVGTLEDYRGQGLAKQVVSALCKTFLAQGKTGLLFTNNKNTIAQKIYATLGFKPVDKYIIAEYKTHKNPTKKHYLKRIKTHFPKLKFNKTKLIKKGWDHDVLILDNKLVFRFPKPTRENRFKSEIKLLKTLQPKSPVPLPHYIYLPKDHSFGGYAMLRGERITRAAFKKCSQKNQAKIAKQIGEFLTLLRSIPLSMIKKAGFKEEPFFWDKKEIQKFRKEIQEVVFPKLNAKEKAWINTAFKNHLALDFNFKKCFVHSDFTDDHIFIDPKKGAVTGIIDFADGEIGDPAYDYGMVWEHGKIFAKEVLAHYDHPVDSCFIERSKFPSKIWMVMDMFKSLQGKKLPHSFEWYKKRFEREVN